MGIAGVVFVVAWLTMFVLIIGEVNWLRSRVNGLEEWIYEIEKEMSLGEFDEGDKDG